MTEPLSASFGKPFDEQMAALRLRLENRVGTVAWDDLVHAEHERAFVVAGALKADLLADLGKAVERAIGEHRSLDKFRAEFRQIVEDRGWHGWTGEGTAKGEAWRTKVIYRTNMATSYAAGRMAQLKAAKYPFWIYKHGNALEPRLQHLAWDGVALPPDHPFWLTHTPVNDWGCTCEVRGAFSERGIKAAGGDPNKKLPDGWNEINPKTGTPVGIGKGWDYQVGASVAAEVTALTTKLPKWPAPIGADAMAMVPRSEIDALIQEFGKFVDKSLSTYVQRDFMIVGGLQQNWLRAAESQGIKVLSAEIAVTDKQVQHTFRGTTAVTVKSTKDVSGLNPKVDPVSLDWYKRLPQHLLAPRAVLLDRRHKKPAFLLIFDVPETQVRLVVEVNTYITKADAELNSIVSGRLVTLRDIKADLAHRSGKVTQIEGEPL